MIRQEATYYDNMQIKTLKTFFDDRIVLIEIYDSMGKKHGFQYECDWDNNVLNTPYNHGIRHGTTRIKSKRYLYIVHHENGLYNENKIKIYFDEYHKGILQRYVDYNRPLIENTYD